MYFPRSIISVCAAAITFLAGGQSTSAAPKLYFADADGDLRVSAFDGSSVATLSGGLGFPAYIEVDHQFIYFTDPVNDRIGRVNLDGSNLTILADAASHGIDSPFGLARIGADGLLVVNNGRIDHLALESGKLTTRVDSFLLSPRGIHLSGETLIIADAGANMVKQVNAAGGLGNPVTNIASVTGLYDVTATSTGQLFVSASHGVYSIMLGSATQVFGGVKAINITGITEAQGVLYFNVSADKRVYQMQLPGGTPTILHDSNSIAGLGSLGGLDTTPIPQIRIADATATEIAGVVNLSVVLNERTSEPVTVDFVTSDDTATALADYVASSGQVTIAPGLDFNEVAITLVEDNRFEDSERFRVDISNATFGSIVDAIGYGTIGPVSPIDSSQKYSWAQNIGWANWRPGVTGSGALTLTTHLGGLIWQQNCGWINLGDGAPDNSYAYQNADEIDFGVNVLSDGRLEGYAWGQNIGWINFEQVHGKPQLDYKTGAMSGYAWGQNVGWINLGTGTPHAVATNLLEYRDTDGDNISDGWELGRIADAGLSTNDPAVDIATLITANGDADGDDVSDLNEFLADTDPFDPGSRLEIISADLDFLAAIDNVTLEWTASAARCYDLHNSVNLETFGTPFTGLVGSSPTRVFEFTDPLPVRKFWSVTPLLPLSHPIE